MHSVVLSASFGLIMGMLSERLIYRKLPFSPVRFVISSVAYAIAFGIAYWLFPPFSMELA